MKCTKCGALLGSNDKFCGQCGTPVAQDAFCPHCGAKLQPNQIFCTTCGMKLDNGAPAADVQTDWGGIPQPLREEGTGKLLRKMNGVTKFFGEPAVGVANKIGTLTVYDNRVEFSRKAGFTLAGTVSAMAKSEVETYYFSDVAEITTGTYLAMYTTLVLKLKNGNKVSFCPAMPVSKDMQTIANLLIHYL